MIPRLYKAAMEGQVQILNEYVNQFDIELTDNNNTVLHIVAQFGQLSCVESILQECRPSLLHTRNWKHETPLHIAARAGNLGTVEALIKRAKEVESEGQTTKELLRAMNLDEDTALHIAVQNVHLQIVRFLTIEDPEFSYPANKAHETPLSLAVERADYDMVVVILDNCSSPHYSGPDGRTALHHAAMQDKIPAIATELLRWKPELIDQPDADGWTPLHYAARCGNVKLVKKILKNNYLLAHIRTGDNDGGKTALHIAAAVGNVPVMKEILSACPESWETVDYTGHNILHIAADLQWKRVLKFILKMSWSSQLMNQKDNEGNTPLHLIAAFQVKGPAFMLKYNQGYWFSFNKKNLNPRELARSQDFRLRYGSIVSLRNILHNDREKLAKWKSARITQMEERKKARQRSVNEAAEFSNKVAKTHVIVATLIATLTFTASFTIPGGYESDKGSEKGMAILVRNPAFKAFVIANTIAVLCSTSSVFLYLIGSSYIHQYFRAARYCTASNLLCIAMVAMMVAFITGTYSTLSHSLGVPIAVLGCIALLIYFEEFVFSSGIRKICACLVRFRKPTKERKSGLECVCCTNL